MFNKLLLKYTILIGLFLFSLNTRADRLRDLITIQGIRDNQLIGYGLVVGLDGTGDQSNQIPYTIHALKNMLSQLGISSSNNSQNAKFKNIAAVIVTAKFPNFIHVGQKIDVCVSSIGDATSLKGGTLLMTPLKGTDKKIYAIAQGNVLINEKKTYTGKYLQPYSIDNHLNNGKIINGATIERESDINFGHNTTLNLQLNNEDFTVAQEISDRINSFYPKSASPLNSKTVQIYVPNNSITQVEMLATIQNINITTPVQDAKVIVNTKTGDIIMNEFVKIDSCAITHKNISITIVDHKLKTNSSFPISTITSEHDYKIQKYEKNSKNKTNSIQYSEKQANLHNIVCALNSLGITTTELISILQAMHDSGCLHAKLEII